MSLEGAVHNVGCSASFPACVPGACIGSAGLLLAVTQSEGKAHDCCCKHMQWVSSTGTPHLQQCFPPYTVPALFCVIAQALAKMLVPPSVNSLAQPAAGGAAAAAAETGSVGQAGMHLPAAAATTAAGTGSVGQASMRPPAAAALAAAAARTGSVGQAGMQPPVAAAAATVGQAGSAGPAGAQPAAAAAAAAHGSSSSPGLSYQAVQAKIKFKDVKQAESFLGELVREGGCSTPSLGKISSTDRGWSCSVSMTCDKPELLSRVKSALLQLWMACCAAPHRWA